MQAGNAALQLALRILRRFLRHQGGQSRMHEAFGRMHHKQDEDGDETRRKTVAKTGQSRDRKAKQSGLPFAKAFYIGPVSKPCVMAVTRPKIASVPPIIASLQPKRAMDQKLQIAG